MATKRAVTFPGNPLLVALAFAVERFGPEIIPDKRVLCTICVGDIAVEVTGGGKIRTVNVTKTHAERYELTHGVLDFKKPSAEEEAINAAKSDDDLSKRIKGDEWDITKIFDAFHEEMDKGDKTASQIWEERPEENQKLHDLANELKEDDEFAFFYKDVTGKPFSNLQRWAESQPLAGPAKKESMPATKKRRTRSDGHFDETMDKFEMLVASCSKKP